MCMHTMLMRELQWNVDRDGVFDVFEDRFGSDDVCEEEEEEEEEGVFDGILVKRKKEIIRKMRRVKK